MVTSRAVPVEVVQLMVLMLLIVLLVDGAKVVQWMKKRKNFFQVFSFSFILQGFHGAKKARLLRQ
jgi:hypothetical protein